MICLIPAAGGGVRFRELGRQYPKAILPYKGRPILIRNLEKLLENLDIAEIVITVGHQAEKVRNCVNAFLPQAVATGRVKFAKYESINDLDGPGVSIGCALRELRTVPEDVLVLLGDLLVESDFEFSKWESFVSVQQVPDWERWCMIESKGGVAVSLFDKPSDEPPTQLALTGIYRFSSGEMFHELVERALTGDASQTGEVEISAFLSPYIETVPTATRTDLVTRDFGTLEEYLSNCGVASSREFNDLSMPTPNTVRKTALYPANSAKIVEEISWYRTMPSELSIMLPRLLDSVVGIDEFHKSPEYTMERVFLPTLRELYLFFESDVKFWRDVFSVIRQSIELFTAVSGDFGGRFWSTLVSKTLVRNEMLPRRFVVDNAAAELSDVIKKVGSLPCDTLFHGDMCLSNIFFDGARSRIMLVDPMGPAVGNFLYDVAKLMQCFVYDYDFVDAELYTIRDGRLNLYNDGKKEIGREFEAFVIDWLGSELTAFVHYLTAILFLNMVPLHSHNQTNQDLFFERYLEARLRSGFVG